MTKTTPILEESVELYSTENDVSLDRRENLVRLINQRLASAIDLQMQMKQAHWNVKGPSFVGLHELFDRAYGEIGEYVDTMAERVVQFGGTARGTVRISAAVSELAEYPLDLRGGLQHVEAVSRALSTFGSEARCMIVESMELEDAGTADIFTEISRGIDKLLWFVEAHGQTKT